MASTKKLPTGFFFRSKALSSSSKLTDLGKKCGLWPEVLWNRWGGVAPGVQAVAFSLCIGCGRASRWGGKSGRVEPVSFSAWRLCLWKIFHMIYRQNWSFTEIVLISEPAVASNWYVNADKVISHLNHHLDSLLEFGLEGGDLAGNLKAVDDFEELIQFILVIYPRSKEIISSFLKMSFIRINSGGAARPWTWGGWPELVR